MAENQAGSEPLSEYVYAGMWRLFRMDGTPENQGGGAGGGGVCGGGGGCAVAGKTTRGTVVVNGLLILSPLFIFGAIAYRKRPLRLVAVCGTLLLGFGIMVLVSEKAQAQNDLAEVDFYYHNDHLMTPMFMTDASGTVVWQMSQSPFDTQIIDEDPDDDDTTVSNPFRFPGQYADSETDNILWYNWNRYYIPSLGRYGQADPINQEISIFYPYNTSIYSYTGNNPVLSFDVYGLEKFHYEDEFLLNYYKRFIPASQLGSVIPSQYRPKLKGVTLAANTHLRIVLDLELDKECKSLCTCNLNLFFSPCIELNIKWLPDVDLCAINIDCRNVTNIQAREVRFHFIKDFTIAY